MPLLLLFAASVLVVATDEDVLPLLELLELREAILAAFAAARSFERESNKSGKNITICKMKSKPSVHMHEYNIERLHTHTRIKRIKKTYKHIQRCKDTLFVASLGWPLSAFVSRVEALGPLVLLLSSGLLLTAAPPVKRALSSSSRRSEGKKGRKGTKKRRGVS